MEIYRIPPFPLITKWEVPDSNTEYFVYIEDMVDHSYETFSLTSNNSSQVVYEVPRTKTALDSSFLFQIKDLEDNIVVDTTLDIVRPYVDVNTLANSASEFTEYRNYELIARSIIDNVVEGGFYNKKTIIQRTGDGADYFAIWDKANKILKAYENDVLVYDAGSENNPYTYRITLDNSAIYRIENTTDAFNRAENMPISIPRGAGDLVHSGNRYVAFPKGYDYIFITDAGYKSVPTDIEKATTLLINDLKCGKLNYYQKYITSYDTEQFKIEMDKRMLEGTGNLIVDKILENYVVNITKPGVL